MAAGLEASSLPGGRPAPGPTIICVDVPDPDNFLMVLRVLQDRREDHVDIVISPRPVSFAAIPYGAAWSKLHKKNFGTSGEHVLDVGHLAKRITQEDKDGWVTELDPSDQGWFYVDEGLSDPEVIEDTKIYLEVCRLRLIRFLDQHGISRDQYRLYTDFNLSDMNTLVPGSHHAFHKPDFAFDFKDMLLRTDPSFPKVGGENRGRLDELCEIARGYLERQSKETVSSLDLFLEAVAGEADFDDGSQRSEKRRNDTRILCKAYGRMRADGRSEYDSLEQLVDKYKSNFPKPLIYVGGPFTEALSIVENLGEDNVGPIIAMAGASHGNNNIFSNQFNILIDDEAANEILRMAQDKKIDVTLLPTECVKGSAYELTWDQFTDSVAPLCEHIRDLYNQWAANRPVNLFDLLAAMVVSTDLYEDMLQSVEFKVNADGKFKFSKAGDAPDGPGLKMFWNEPSGDGKLDRNPAMLEKREAYSEELKKTLAGCNSSAATGTKSPYS